MSQIELSLDPKSKKPPDDRHPVIGYCAVGFGIAGIFINGLVFVPLGLICSVAALVVGQIAWGIGGIALALIGIVTSPTLWALLGLGALAVWLGLAA